MSNNSDNSSDQWMDGELEKNDIIVFIFLIFIMIMGMVGNTFVCYIFYFRLDRTAINLLVTALGMCDFFSSLVCIPLDIIILFYPQRFKNDITCRIIRFVDMDINVISALIVFVISIDRFQKVVRPLGKQIARQQVGLVCLVIACFSTGLSLPCLFLVMTGMQCTLSNGPRDSMLYIISLVASCTLVFLTLCTIYCLVGIKLCRYEIKRQSLFNSTNSPSYITSSTKERSVDNGSQSYVKEQQQLDKMKKTKVTKNNGEINEEGSSSILLELRKSSSKTKLPRLVSTTRTTLIMFLVSFTWVISFVPHLTVIVLLALKPNTRTIKENLIYNICLRSFYFNNMADPWIYAIFNSQFRRELCVVLRGATGH